MIKRILETTGATDYECFISGGNNFRYQVDPTYKANRKDKPQPIYRADANAYLVTEFGAKVTDGYEADDAIGIAASRIHDFIICSIDKDLKQIPGKHYNWRKDEFDIVSHIDAKRSFYRQLLTGDAADGIRGVGGIGPVKSAKLINNLMDEVDMFQVVSALYSDDTRLLSQGKLLYILRHEEDDWGIHFTQLQEQAAKQLSQTSSPESNDPTSDTI